MGLGNLAIGLASIVLGVHQLKNGAKHLSGVKGLSDVEKPFMTSGRHTVKTPNGERTAMRMRSYRIRSLDDRIAHIRRLVDAGKRDPRVYAFARRAVSKRCGDDWCIKEKDNLSEAKAVFGALRQVRPPQLSPQDLALAKSVFDETRRSVRYTSDIMGVDTYQKPSHTLALRSGDCDDYTGLVCSALGSLGIPCFAEVIRTKDASDWNHIYASAGLPRANPTRLIPMDASVNAPFGWKAPDKMVAARRVFRLT